MTTRDTSDGGSLPDRRPHISLIPDDAANQCLVENVRPPNWQNPRVAGRYNLVVIGAGAAGLVSAAGAAGLGAKVALVERHMLGGDCLNVGCVPSKALIRSARVWAEVRDAGRAGVDVPPGAHVSFQRAMARMRELRASLSPLDSAKRFQKLGVDVFFGQATFIDRHAIRVADQTLHFKRAIVATGARAAVPNIWGLKEVGFLTNESVFSLAELPQHLAVIGAGPVGCELAQCFARLGSNVCLLEAAPRILPNDDPAASEILARALERDGVRTFCGVTNLSFARDKGKKRLQAAYPNGPVELFVDEILLGVGRTPNVEGLGLEAAGVRHNGSGIWVSDRLQTTNRRIFAAGDICSNYKFTHAADAMARIAIQNALFLGRAKFNSLRVPWCTYTEPEVAGIGLREREALQRGIAFDIFEHRMADVDRAVLDGQTEGFVKVLTKKGTDRILGATIVAAHAGDLIAELSVAIASKIGLKAIARTIHPYPTQSEGIKKVADSYSRSRLTPRLHSVLRWWMSRTR